jgi:CRP-like cAMP-binding protein
MKNKIPFLYALFNSFGIFTDAEIEYILTHFESKTYQKGAIVLDFGQINDKLYFIESGILREFSMKDEDEDEDEDEDQTITNWLMSENDFQYSAESFLDQKPSQMAIEVLEKAKLWTISKQKLDKLYMEFPQLNMIGRIMTETYVKKYEVFVKVLRQSKAKRLDWFYKYHKDITNRVLNKHIATYLNMSPQELSRVRAKTAKKK